MSCHEVSCACLQRCLQLYVRFNLYVFDVEDDDAPTVPARSFSISPTKVLLKPGMAVDFTIEGLLSEAGLWSVAAG